MLGVDAEWPPLHEGALDEQPRIGHVAPGTGAAGDADTSAHHLPSHLGDGDDGHRRVQRRGDHARHAIVRLFGWDAEQELDRVLMSRRE